MLADAAARSCRTAGSLATTRWAGRHGSASDWPRTGERYSAGRAVEYDGPRPGGPPPAYGGHGRHPKAPFRGVRAWCESLPAGAWTRITVRDGEKGPLEVEVVARRVESKVERRVVGFEETLVVVRYIDGGVLKQDYHLSNAARTTPLAEFARVAKAAHRIEECLKRAKSEAGLGEYQVRNWRGWHHHMALSLIATWFLVVESRRGKKGGPGVDGAAGAEGLALIFTAPAGAIRRPVWRGSGPAGWSGTSRRGSITTRHVIN